MKIKKLSIRNIASIEKADIDFDNDLMVPGTSTPATLFLIGGDTGAGKSVILDAIAMALYGTTPRIKSTGNKNNNNYKTQNGETVSVNSLAQYTRLGISDKDDCYCELVFEGNDGKTYTARTTLGFKRTGGLREANQSLVFDGNTISKSKEINAIISDKDVVGLSFEQFCRMAMLAQGQFATFLCGSKEEREKVLEQLTDTKHFSAYGAAISEIHKNKAAAVKDKESQIAGIKSTLLSDEEKADKQQQLADARAEKQKLSGEKEKSDAVIRSLDAFLKAKNALDDIKEKEDAQKTAFEALSKGMVYMKAALDAKQTQLDAEKEWIDLQAEKADLYAAASGWETELQQYSTCLTEKQTKTKSLTEEQKKTKGLQDAENQARDADDKAAKLVTDKQAEIDAKIKERDALHPDQVISELQNVNKHITSLTQLDNARQAWDDARQKAQNADRDVADTMKNIENLKPVVLAKKADFDAAKKRFSQEQAHYFAMEKSVDQSFANVRAQLRDEDNCPLCGQKVDMTLLKKNFRACLDPMKQALKKFQDDQDDAENAYNKEHSLLAQAEGTLKLQQKTQTEKHKEETDALNALTPLLQAEKLNLDDNLAANIQLCQEKLKAKREDLQSKQDTISAIQKQIDALQEDKKPLDAAKIQTAKVLADAKSVALVNGTNINNLNKSIRELTDKITDAETKFNESLTPFYPTWKAQPDQVKNALHKDAGEYTTRKTDYDKANADHSTRSNMYGRMLATQTSVTATRAWTLPADSEPYTGDDMENAWTALRTTLATLDGQKTTATDTVNAEQPKLLPYYVDDVLQEQQLHDQNKQLTENLDSAAEKETAAKTLLDNDTRSVASISTQMQQLDALQAVADKWKRINDCFGGNRFRTLVQTHILRPLLNNANIYLQEITDRYRLTCSSENEQLSILVLDRYNRDEVRSVTVLSGGERFMISLALSLALSSLNRPDMNANILFIDEGFGTLDEASLNSVMSTLERLQVIAENQNRRVGIISHRTELEEMEPQIFVRKMGQGRSVVECPYQRE